MFTTLEGTGQDAVYEIRGFAGIRIIRVDLNGGEKHVLVQAAPVVTRSGKYDETAQTSYSIYSPVRLAD